MASKNGFGIIASKKMIKAPCLWKCFSRNLTVLCLSNFFFVNFLPECPNANPSISPKQAPTDATTATRTGEYRLPPVIIVKNAGAETKKVALETKFTINIPSNPRDEASLK